MFELYREDGKAAPADEAEGAREPGTDLVVAAGGEEPGVGRWRWQLTLGDKVLARSEESWGKRSAAKAAVDKLKSLVASAAIVEKL